MRNSWTTLTGQAYRRGGGKKQLFLCKIRQSVRSLKPGPDGPWNAPSSPRAPPLPLAWAGPAGLVPGRAPAAPSGRYGRDCGQHPRARAGQGSPHAGQGSGAPARPVGRSRLAPPRPTRTRGTAARGRGAATRRARAGAPPAQAPPSAALGPGSIRGGRAEPPARGIQRGTERPATACTGLGRRSASRGFPEPTSEQIPSRETELLPRSFCTFSLFCCFVWGFFLNPIG